MKPTTQEWIDKAEGDWISAQREARARKQPNYDLACFASQQCAEKYLKACLDEANLAFRKTHDLEALLNLLLPSQAGLSGLLLDLQNLNDYAVDYRYPGQSADKLKAKDAIQRCRRVRRALRLSLGLPV
jgi:HEPN domain-containing protein